VVSDELAQWLRTQFRWDEQDIQFLQDASSRADMMVGKLITLALEKEDWEILQSLPTEYARDVHDQIDAEIEELDRKLAFLDDHVAIGDEEQEIFSL
jgi:hypothetical protein